MEWVSGGLLFAFCAVIITVFACAAVVMILVMVDMLRDFWRYWTES